MTDTKHTPGPWNVTMGENNMSLYLQCQAREVPDDRRCLIGWFYYSAIPKEEREANAHLIAAAPELLEALEEIASEECYLCERRSDIYCKAKNDECFPIQLRKQLIAKAKGEAD